MKFPVKSAPPLDNNPHQPTDASARGNFFNNPIGGDGVKLGAAHAGRQEQLVNAGLVRQLGQLGRYPPLPVHRFPRGADVGRQANS